MNKDFTNYLMEKHGEQYVGTDDCMIDDFNTWVQDLGVDELIEYADKYTDNIKKEIGNIDLTEEVGKAMEVYKEYLRIKQDPKSSKDVTYLQLILGLQVIELRNIRIEVEEWKKKKLGSLKVEIGEEKIPTIEEIRIALEFLIPSRYWDVTSQAIHQLIKNKLK
jgi:hypothetical protein